MHDFYLIVNWIVTVALAALGFVALLKNRSLILNKVFALFTVTIGIWIMASYISNDVHNSAHASVIGNYFVFLFSYVSGYLLLWFAITLAKDKKAAHRLRKFSIPIALIGVISCTPLVVAGAKRQGGVYAVGFGPMVVLYFLALLMVLVTAMVILHKNIKSAEGDQRAHMVVLYRSMGVALPILLITEFILPAITGWFGLTNIGILAMAIPVLGLYYSVVRLKLFNLRLVIVRSLAYVITLAFIATIYSFVSYYLSTLIKITNDQSIQVALNVVLIIAAINIYPPLIRIFRHLTNRLFYRDAYDSQAFLDDFNKVVVATYDLNLLLQRSARIIEENIKPAYALFLLKETSTSPKRYVGAGSNPEYNDADIISVRAITTKMSQKVIISELLEEKYKDLQKVLLANDIGLIGRLTSLANEEGVGYLILGPKKSGNLYSSQDLKVVEIIANELVIAIQNALRFEEIQKFNITLQAKVDEATKELKKTNEKLKALDETKDDFISMASHQLRTPLSIIKGYVNMVVHGDAGKINKQQMEFLDQAQISSETMVRLVTELLNVSRITSGKFSVDSNPVNLADIVENEVQQLTNMAEERDIELTFQKPKDFPILLLDEEKIRQVVANFIDNAIHYSKDKGAKINVQLTNKDDIIFEVIDNGIGVPPNEKEHLFTKFYRAKNAKEARPNGTGVGIYLAKVVINELGGDLIFESKEGVGSTFGFRFKKDRIVQPDSKS